MKFARDENLTHPAARDPARRRAATRFVTGTAEHIADVMEEWFTTGAADGFNILPPYMPGAFDDFVELVIPELQRRGLFRTEYEGHDAAREPRPAAAREPLRRSRGLCRGVNAGSTRPSISV